MRAARARIDAIWLAPSAPDLLRRRVALAGPNARLSSDRDEMLAANPPSRLPSYRRTSRSQRWRTTASQVLFAAVVLTLGGLPDTARTGALWNAWFAMTLSVSGALVVVAADRVGPRVSACAVLLEALLCCSPPLPVGTVWSAGCSARRCW